MQALDLGSPLSRQGASGFSRMVCKYGRGFWWGRPRGAKNSLLRGGGTREEDQSTIAGLLPCAYSGGYRRWSWTPCSGPAACVCYVATRCSQGGARP